MFPTLISTSSDISPLLAALSSIQTEFIQKDQTRLPTASTRNAGNGRYLTSKIPPLMPAPGSQKQSPIA
jgi:hypothetical protein